MRLCIATGVVCALGPSAALAQAGGSWTFTRIANLSTPVPGGSGTFTDFYAPGVDAGGITFWGRRMVGSTVVSEGVYRRSGLTLSRVADLTTALPAPRTGNFPNFDLRPTVGGGTVALTDEAGWQGGGGGVYTSTGSGLTRVTDVTDPVPNAPTLSWGNFRGVSVDGSTGGYVASTFSSPGSAWFAYGWNGQTRTVLAQDGGAQPHNADGTFNSFAPVTSTSGGRVLFEGVGGGVLGQEGVYTASVNGGPLTVVADRTTPVPGHPTASFGSFIGNGDHLDLDGPNAAFLAQYSGSNIGVYTNLGGAVRKVIDSQTLIPGRTDTFTSFDTVSISGNKIAFFGGNGNYFGLYAEVGGVLQKVLARGDPIDGRAAGDFYIGNSALYGDTLVFTMGFADGTRAVYSAQYAPGPGGWAVLMGAGVMARRHRRRSETGRAAQGLGVRAHEGTHPDREYAAPKRPADPDRRGTGVPEKDR